MIHLYEDIANFPIKGTIIDFETIGKFNNEFQDYRQYIEIEPIMFGTLEGDKIKIHYIESTEYLEDFMELIRDKLAELQEPFWAFNKAFEQGVVYNCLDITLDFKELQKKKYEAKRQAVRKLNIPNFNDPFHDRGALAMKAWEEGNIEDCVKHNRACLLKEAMIWKYRYSLETSFSFISI